MKWGNQRGIIHIASPDLNGKEFVYLSKCFKDNWISSQGEFISRFENDLSDYCGVKYGIAVMNGTVALHLALLALGIGPGDEVVVPDLTFVATINAVLYTGATPVIVDVEKDSWCIDPQEFKKSITEKTKAIIPVHLYGQPCDMKNIIKYAREQKIFVVEDCAEAIGAEYGNKKVGSFGDISCFSFFANKIITTGEGGMCLTDNYKIYNKMRTLRDHGMSKNRRYWHDAVGYNYRMTNMQAAVGVAQLERIKKILKRREWIEEYYFDLLTGMDIVLQKKNFRDRKKVCWVVSCLFENGLIREELMNYLQKSGICTRPFFFPLSMMPIYSKYARKNTPIASDIYKKGINLPTYHSIAEKEIEIVVSAIKRYYRNKNDSKKRKG